MTSNEEALPHNGLDMGVLGCDTRIAKPKRDSTERRRNTETTTRDKAIFRRSHDGAKSKDKL